MDSLADRLRDELNSATRDATDEDLQKAPSGKWNSAYILEHLYLSYLHTNRGIARCLAKGAPLATRPTMRQRMKCLVVLGFGYFPEGVKAPAVAMPQGMRLAELRDMIFGEMEKMYAALDDCERRFGRTTKLMDHPIMGPLTAGEWRKLHWLHARHHARQIRERTRL